jgi:Flp pilus assembly pilin Flp
MFANKFVAFLMDEEAPTAAEYAIIITLGLAIIAAGIGAFFAAVNGAFQRGTSLLGG